MDEPRLVGKVFGDYIVESVRGVSVGGTQYYECRCQTCGEVVIRSNYTIRRKNACPHRREKGIFKANPCYDCHYAYREHCAHWRDCEKYQEWFKARWGEIRAAAKTEKERTKKPYGTRTL